MDTLKQMKDSVLDKAKEAGQMVASVAKDAQERAVEAKDRVVELADSAKDRVMEMADTAKDRVMGMADTAKDRVMGMADTALDKIKGLTDREGALKLLKEDHSLVSGYFDQIEALKDDPSAAETCEGLFSQLKYELETHAQVEERLVYPILKEYDAPLMQEAYSDHAEMKRLLGELSMQKGTDWFVRISVLKQMVQNHVAQEEGAIFELARKVLTNDELNSLGARLQAEKVAMAQEPEKSGSATASSATGSSPEVMDKDKPSTHSMGNGTDRSQTRSSGNWAQR